MLLGKLIHTVYLVSALVFHHAHLTLWTHGHRELREEGKIRNIGFSTHAPAHVIKQGQSSQMTCVYSYPMITRSSHPYCNSAAIETDAFDYVNCKYR